MSTLVTNEIEILLDKLEEIIKKILETHNETLLSEKESIEAKLELKLKKLKIKKDNNKHDAYSYRYNKIEWSYYKQTDQTETIEYYENELNYLTNSYVYLNEELDLDTSIEVVSDTDNDEYKSFDSFSQLVTYLNQQNIIRNETKTALIQFNKLQLKLITNLSSYINMIEQYKLLNNELENTITLNKDDLEVAHLLASILNHLDDLKNTHLISFIIHVQNLTEPEHVLFENTDQINKHFRLLSLYFHPDKIDLADKELAKNFFYLIKQSRDKLVAKSNKDFEENDIKSLVEHANDYFKQANKYRLESFKYLTDRYEYRRNKELCKHFAMLAYGQFKLACKLADQSDDVSKQFELRKNMLSCFYISNKILEAQLTGVSLLFLIQKHSKKISLQQRNEVKNLLDQINNFNLNNKTDEITLDNSLIELDDLNELNNKITDELKRGNTLILSKIENVRLDAPKTDLIKATSKKEWKVQKLAYDVGLVLSLFAIPGTILANLAGTLMGLYVIIDQRQKLVNKLFYLEQINKIIQSALDEYKKSNYLGFLTKLTQPYNSENFLSLFKIDSNRIDINPQNLVLTLLEFNFPPDGIGYLLNLIANALVSGIRFKQLPFYRVQSLASDILDQISCRELEEKAIKLDRDISSLRRLIGKAKANFSLIRGYFFPNKQQEPDVADELVEESPKKGSFLKRLGEIKLVAKINTAILSIVNAGLGGIDSAKVYIDQVRTLINEQSCFHYNEETRMRLELLELLFWSFTGQDVDSFENLNQLTIQSSDQLDEYEFNTSDQYLNYLDNLIQKTHDKKEKCYLFNKKGNRLAEKAQSNKDDYFKHYKLAYKAYLSSYKLESNRNLAAIQIVKCLICLKQFREAISVSTQLIDNLFYENNYQLWLLRGISYRSVNDFKSALHCLDESIKKQPSERAKKELALVRELQLNKFLYETAFINLNTLNDVVISNNKYRILSIDSGGINSILALIFLIEIEHRIRKPISELFDLIVGSSFSSLIPFLLNFMNASDLFGSYCSKINTLFQSRNFILSSYKYKRRLNLFDDLIDSNMCLNENKNDILVPAIRCDHTIKIFSTFKAKLNQNENFKIRDIIWASSVMPSYFEPFELEKVCFTNCVDNPAKLAYLEVINSQNIDFKCVNFLSLGTGCYLNNIDFEKYNEQFKNEFEIDNYLKSQKGLDQYARFQFYLPEAIKLDEYHKLYDLISYGKQFIEENTLLIDEYIQNMLF